MSKKGKRYFNKNNSGNWFMPIDVPKTEHTRDLSPSTGSMLTHGVTPSLMQGAERYPKIFINPEQKTTGREYSFSVHDNRTALQDTIHVYDQGLGRKKCLDGRRQHNSHYCLCHHDTVNAVGSGRWNHSVYQTDFLSKQDTEGTEAAIRRRFPREHPARSQMNAIAQAGETFMWFGRHDSDQYAPLSVLAGANLSLTSQKRS